MITNFVMADNKPNNICGPDSAIFCISMYHHKQIKHQ